MSDRRRKATVFFAVLMAGVMALSMVATPAMAADFNSGEPGNLNVGLDNTELDFAEAEDITAPGPAVDDGNIFIDLQPLEDRGIDTGDLTVNVDAEDNDDIAFSTVVDQRIQIAIVDDPPSDEVELQEVELQGIDSSELDADDVEEDVPFDLTMEDDAGNLVFDRDSDVDIVSIENVDEGVFYGSLDDALTDDEGLSAEDTIEVSNGTFLEDEIAESGVEAADVTLSGADATSVQHPEETDNTLLILDDDSEDGLEVQDITLDMVNDDDDAQAVEISGGASAPDDVTLSGIAIENVDENNDQSLIETASQNALTITESEIVGPGDEPDTVGVEVDDDEDVTVTDSTVEAHDTGLDLDSASDTTVEGTTFDVNDLHVDADDATAIFEDDTNTFDQYSIILDDGGNVDTGIYGQIDALRDSGEDTIEENEVLEVSGDDHRAVDGGVFTLKADDADDFGDFTIRSPDGDDAEDAVIVSDEDNLFQLDVNTQAEDATAIESVVIDAVTIDFDDDNAGALVIEDDAGSDPDTVTIESLVIEDSQFLNSDGDPSDDVESTIALVGDQAIDGGATTDEVIVNTADISGNTFGYDDDGNALAIETVEGVDVDSEAGEFDISDNVFDNADLAIEVGTVDAAGDAGLVVTIEENEDFDVTDFADIGSDSINLNGADELTINVDENAGELGDNGIVTGDIDTEENVEVTIVDNTLEADESSGTGINVDDDSGSDDGTLTITDNTVIGFSDDGTGLDVTEIDDLETELTIEDNDFEDSTTHADFDDSVADGQDILDDNAFDPLVVALDEEDGDLSADATGLFGSVDRAVTDAGSGDFVEVGSGEYDESAFTPIASAEENIEIVGVEGAEETTILNDQSANTFDLDTDGQELVGVTINSTDDAGDFDLNLDSTDVVVESVVLDGPEDGNDERNAIEVSEADSISNVEASNYEVGATIADDATLNQSAFDPVADGIDITAGSAVVDDVAVNATGDFGVDAEGTEIELTDLSIDLNDGVAGVVVNDADTSELVLNESSIDVTDGGDGILIDEGDTQEVDIADNTITANETAVNLQDLYDDNGEVDATVVRNVITDSGDGIFVNGDEVDETIIHFNDLVNFDGLAIEEVDADEGIESAAANWYGDATGPSGAADDGGDEFAGEGDEVSAESDGDTFNPWLSQSVTELPDDEYVVVTDQRNIFTDDPNGVFSEDSEADIVIAVLDDGLAADVEGEEDTAFLTPDGGSFTEPSETTSSAAEPMTGTFEADDPGDYTIEATNTDNDPVNNGAGVQTIIAEADGVELTAEADTVIADGEDQTNVTMQLTSDGEPVSQSGVDVSFDIVANATEAGAQLEVFDDTTDTNGQAQAGLNATNATFDVDVRSIAVGQQDTVTISTIEEAEVNFTLELVDGPTQIVQNESYEATVNVTNEGDGGKPTTLIAPLEINRETPAAHRPFVQTGNSANAIVPNRVYSYTRLDTGEHR